MSGLPARLSPTSIDCWRQCPRRYYHQYIERRPFVQAKSYEQTLGEVVHKALEGLFRLAPARRDEEAAERLLNSSLLRFAHVPALRKGRDERLRHEAHELLTSFIRAGRADVGVTESSAHADEGVGNSGGADEAGGSATTLKVEQTFQLRLKNGTAIQTRVDRVDRGESGLLRVIDYKTGRVQLDEQDLGRETAPIVQLLAVGKASEIPVEKVSWLYLRSGESIEWWPEPDDVDFATERLIKVLRAMHADREFEPNPGGHCVTCPFSAICPAWPSGANADGEVAEAA